MRVGTPRRIVGDMDGYLDQGLEEYRGLNFLFVKSSFTILGH